MSMLWHAMGQLQGELHGRAGPGDAAAVARHAGGGTFESPPAATDTADAARAGGAVDARSVALPGRQACRFYAAGRCRRGDACWYAHAAAEGRAADGGADPGGAAPSAAARCGPALPQAAAAAGSRPDAAGRAGRPAALPAPGGAALTSGDVFGVARVLETRPTLVLHPGETGRGYESLYGAFAAEARVVYVQSPYLAGERGMMRLVQFLDMLQGFPTVHAVWVDTDTSGGDKAGLLGRLQAYEAMRGLRLSFRRVDGLHHRALFFIHASFTWVVHCDRGLGHLRHGPLDASPDTARCMRTQIEARRVEVGEAAIGEAAGLGHPLDAEEVEPAALSALLERCTLARLRRRLRGAQGLQLRHDRGEVLDPLAGAQAEATSAASGGRAPCGAAAGQPDWRGGRRGP